MELTDSKKILLAKLKYRDPVGYREKLDALDVHEYEIQEFINREIDRKNSLAKIDEPEIGRPKKSTKSRIAQGYTYKMGGKPYWSPVPVEKKEKVVPPKKKKEEISVERHEKSKRTSRKIYILVDGDNNPYRNMEGYEKAKRMDNVQVLVCVADKNLGEKYLKQYGVSIKYIEQGDQAVDNLIKSIAGNKIKNHEYDELVIVSEDKGYLGKMDRWKKEYNLSSKHIRLCKNIKEALR